MDDAPVDHARRHFLTLATAVAGGIGVALAATPFITYFRPSARAMFLGQPVRVDVSKIDAGSLLRVEWRGQPVFVLKRTAAALASLNESESLLKDPNSDASIQPDYAKNQARSVNGELLVMKGVCTHLGCAPLYRPSVTASDVTQPWFGGFFCPCHGSKFDLAGRVYAGVPAQTNLEIPPYRFISNSELVIGDDGAAS